MAESYVTTTSCIVRGQPQRIVLLSTAVVDVYAANGRRYPLRALLDSGSQASFMTERAACTLMLRQFRFSVSVSTFASSDSTIVRGKCNIKMSPSGQQSPSFCLDVSIVPQITGPTPQTPVTFGHWNHINSLSLADPSYNTPGPIGADLLPSVFLDGTRKGQVGEPLAMNTVFGWVLMGPTDLKDRSSVTILSVNVSEPIDSLIKKFWDLEELPVTCHLSPADVAAEKIYTSTTTRLSSGRFVVTLPFLKPRPKPDTLTTKLRVVFNASAKTSAGLSLNDSMYTGPKLQPDIQVVLLRARLWKYMFMADIKQMYRQILIRPADRDYLRIL